MCIANAAYTLVAHAVAEALQPVLTLVLFKLYYLYVVCMQTASGAPCTACGHISTSRATYGNGSNSTNGYTNGSYTPQKPVTNSNSNGHYSGSTDLNSSSMALSPDDTTNDITTATATASTLNNGVTVSKSNTCAALLLEAAVQSNGLSGRALRKLPFQAHAFHIQKTVCSLEEFLHALLKMVHTELSCRDDLNKDTPM
jgi:hypothetical protein